MGGEKDAILDDVERLGGKKLEQRLRAAARAKLTASDLRALRDYVESVRDRGYDDGVNAALTTEGLP